MRNGSELRALFLRDGFVNGGCVLSEEELATLRHEVERFSDVHLRGKPADGPMPKFGARDYSSKHYTMSEAYACSAIMRGLAENERLLELAAELHAARTLHVGLDTIHYKPPTDGAAVQWHQDGHYPLVVGIGNVDRILTAWVALDDADEESGCMWMVPGSHRWGYREPYLSEHFSQLEHLGEIAQLRRPDDLDPSEWREPVPCPVKAGEVHFHHSFTWHASPTNRSDRVRRAYTIFYSADGVTGQPDNLPCVFERSRARPGA